MTSPSSYSLTTEQKSHFLAHGFVHLRQCFTRDASAAFTSDLWTRLGMSASDKSTWHTERTHMPSQNSVLVSEFAPKAWSAICELLGGEDRIADSKKSWRDAFIVNLGKEGQGETPFRKLYNWHVDGDFFVHFLDSPEQALLVIPLFSDIAPGGGGTVICTDGIGHIARHLYNHPGGVTPGMHPRGASDPKPGFFNSIVQTNGLVSSASFHEMTGEVGDVYLLHPLMLHSASHNALRIPRIITNPPVALKEPFRLDPKDGELSIVEQKTLKELGRLEGLGGWHIEGGREYLEPNRIKVQADKKEKEKKRLED
ncbi:hypothetical protein C8J57DRAFT_1727618 [Mycena rebaudengoi]|nr:hypothetical protein C8J57DRAFT_1727618 [Mycena rebaudengoi]